MFLASAAIDSLVALYLMFAISCAIMGLPLFMLWITLVVKTRRARLLLRQRVALVVSGVLAPWTCSVAAYFFWYAHVIAEGTVYDSTADSLIEGGFFGAQLLMGMLTIMLAGILLGVLAGMLRYPLLKTR